MMEGSFSDNIIPEYSLNEEESKAFKLLLEINRDQIMNISIPKSLRDVMTEHLITYFRLHISGFRTLNSLEVLRSVL